MTLTISASEARRLVLALQGLADPPRRKLTAEGLLELVERLGYVQIDSINWVARAHHMILFARNQTYRPELLRRLAEDEAQLFEHWTHDASCAGWPRTRRSCSSTGPTTPRSSRPASIPTGR
jgi:uncharacterized protein YcaQ